MMAHARDIAAGAVALGASAAALTAYATFAPWSALWCPVIRRGPDDSPRVALTFDDGPWPESTPAILDILGAASVSAAFFVIGRNAASRPDLLERIGAQGHLLCNHTYDHDHFGIMRRGPYWLDQIERTDREIARVAGADPAFFRPPMGFKTGHMAAALRRRGHRAVAWSRRAFDGTTTTSERIKARLSRCRPGDIIALHDGVDPHRPRDPRPSVAALAHVIASIRSSGLEPVRLDRLLDLPAYQSPVGDPVHSDSIPQG
jgi:peptidoglycan/xylan/chitin deacetylase (PgdA/CDA1 family)